jgi:hypothetical protein
VLGQEEGGQGAPATAQSARRDGGGTLAEEMRTYYTRYSANLQQQSYG